MVLGDNIFYGNGFKKILREAAQNSEAGRATIFGYYVNDPERFGIVEFDEQGKVRTQFPPVPKSQFLGVSESSEQSPMLPQGGN